MFDESANISFYLDVKNFTVNRKLRELLHELGDRGEAIADEELIKRVEMHLALGTLKVDSNNGAAISSESFVDRIKPTIYTNPAVQGASNQLSVASPKPSLDTDSLKPIVPTKTNEQRALISAAWGQPKVKRADTVSLKVDTSGFKDNQRLHITIYEVRPDGSERVSNTMHGYVKNNQLAANWQFSKHFITSIIPTQDELSAKGQNYKPPTYVFVAKDHLGNDATVKSNLMEAVDWVEIQLLDYDEQPIADEEINIRLADNSEHQLKTDSQGVARLEDIAPGPVVVDFPSRKNKIEIKAEHRPRIVDQKDDSYDGLPGYSGTPLRTRLLPPIYVIDVHMHIQSGRCAPLPLIWDKSVFVRLFGTRDTLEKLGNVALGTFGGLQKMPTDKIGDSAVSSNSKHYEKVYGHQSKDLLSAMTVMMMDMDYAHIAGYQSKPIYQFDSNNNLISYVRKNGTAPDTDGKVIKYKSKEINTYETWAMQIQRTIASAVKHPWKFMPMFHYDPRRHQDDWHGPLTHIATASQKGKYIGVKMYTSLGYKPLDERLPHMNDLYAFCESNNIPIMCHCTPDGMYTHEREFYIDLATPEIQRQTVEEYLAKHPVKGRWQKFRDISEIVGRVVTSPMLLSRIKDSVNKRYGPNPASRFATAVGEYYFNRHFVHPRAWEPVLEKYPNLTLCLAHFGGDVWKHEGVNGDWIQSLVKLLKTYKNVYTDISYFFVNNYRSEFQQLIKGNIDLLDKIMFGTDWYLIENDKHSYEKFCDMTEFVLSRLELKWNEKWFERFAVINCMKYLGLKNKASNLADALKGKLSDKDFVREYKIEKADELKKEFDWGAELLAQYDEAKYKSAMKIG